MLNFSFFTMNYFVYACIKKDGGYATKCTVAYSQQGRIKHFDFLAHAIKEWPLSICHILKLFLRRINGRIFERILLEYLFHILTKVKISSQDIYVSKHFTLVSEIQNFLYSEILNRPAPDYRRSFYICGRSDKKYN